LYPAFIFISHDRDSMQGHCRRLSSIGARLNLILRRCGLHWSGRQPPRRIEREHIAVVFTLRMPQAQQPEAPEGPVNRLPDAVTAWSRAERGG